MTNQGPKRRIGIHRRQVAAMADVQRLQRAAVPVLKCSQREDARSFLVAILISIVILRAARRDGASRNDAASFLLLIHEYVVRKASPSGMTTVARGNDIFLLLAFLSFQLISSPWVNLHQTIQDLMEQRQIEVLANQRAECIQRFGRDRAAVHWERRQASPRPQLIKQATPESGRVKHPVNVRSPHRAIGRNRSVITAYFPPTIAGNLEPRRRGRRADRLAHVNLVSNNFFFTLKAHGPHLHRRLFGREGRCAVKQTQTFH